MMIIGRMKLLFIVRVLSHFLYSPWMQIYYYQLVDGMCQMKEKEYIDLRIHFDSIVRLLHYFGVKIKCPARMRSQRSTSSDSTSKFDSDIRPSFIRHSVAVQR